MDNPVRVLHVIGQMDRAGAETMLMNIYRHIDRNKVQFDFLVCTEQKCDYDDEILSLGGKIYHNLEYFSPVAIPRIIKKCNAFFKKHPYPVVHCHIGSLSLFVLNSAKKNGAYAVAHCHSTNAQFSGAMGIYKLFKNPADYFFACGIEAGKSAYGEKIVNSDRFKVINNAIDVGAFSFSEQAREKIRDKYGLNGKFVIGTSARLIKLKNLGYAVDVLAELIKQKPESMLVIAGEGEQRPYLTQKIDEMGLNEKVLLPGNISNVNEFLSALDVYVMPSVYEGLPVSAVEAQANGLNCIFSSGISREVKLTDNVFFEDINVPPAVWADKIISFKDYTHKDNSEQIKRAGYDISESAKDMMEFYLSHIK